MENLLIKSAIKIEQVPQGFKRYLFDQINFNQRLIGIRGARGVGKTTLLLQIAHQFSNSKVLYVSLDDLFFNTQASLHGLAQKFSQQGGTLLLLDEVHKHPNWSREIKLIYDDFPDLQTIFTSSSILDIYKGESDLSRRAITYELKSLSFREYLAFSQNLYLPFYSLEEMIENHQSIALKLLQETKPLAHFQDYLKIGAFPFYIGNQSEYYQQLIQTINLILEVDLPSIQSIDYTSITKIKRLLHILSLSVPFTPNISKLSERVSLPRNTLVQVLHWLSKAHLIHSYYKTGKSISVLNKPDKLWLNNTNFSYALSDNRPDKGNLRETFFLSQLAVHNSISLPEKGDFFINDKYTFEVGGKNKTSKQIKGIKNAFIVKDDIEIGFSNQIPLWLFGFLY